MFEIIFLIIGLVTAPWALRERNKGELCLYLLANVFFTPIIAIPFYRWSTSGHSMYNDDPGLAHPIFNKKKKKD